MSPPVQPPSVCSDDISGLIPFSDAEKKAVFTERSQHVQRTFRSHASHVFERDFLRRASWVGLRAR